MSSPLQPVRRDLRYPLQLPVSVRLADREIDGHSENVSLHGILLSSTVLIPEGSTVHLAVTVGTRPNRSFLLTGRGRVLRVRLKNPRDFLLAIECEQAFQLTQTSSGSRPGE